MPIKGQIMTQSHFEKEEKYVKLLKESYWRREMQQNEVIAELRSMGFSSNRATIISKEWLSNTPQLEPEEASATKRKQKEMASLKRYFINKNKKVRKWDEEKKKWITVNKE